MRKLRDIAIKKILIDSSACNLLVLVESETWIPEIRSVESKKARDCGLFKFGVPYEIRTRVIAVKGRCPRPLDEGDLRLLQYCNYLFLVEVSGIEPLTSCMPCKRSPS